MEVVEYTDMINRFAKRFEKWIEQDFPGDMDLASTVNYAFFELHYGIIGAFMRKSENKEKK